MTNASISQIHSELIVQSTVSVFKELIENSIDSEAGKIQIEFSNFGLDKIVFIDDGKGISFEDLSLLG